MVYYVRQCVKCQGYREKNEHSTNHLSSQKAGHRLSRRENRRVVKNMPKLSGEIRNGPKEESSLFPLERAEDIRSFLGW
jgi:hypothetical protein